MLTPASALLRYVHVAYHCSCELHIHLGDSGWILALFYIRAILYVEGATRSRYILKSDQNPHLETRPAELLHFIRRLPALKRPALGSTWRFPGTISPLAILTALRRLSFFTTSASAFVQAIGADRGLFASAVFKVYST